jgi:hypothetical protein
VDRDKRFEGNFVVAVKLRLVRMGKKKQPTYRVVAAESRRARSGAFLEIVGTYQPRGISVAEPETVTPSTTTRSCAGSSRAPSRPSAWPSCSKSGALEAFEATKVTKAAQ